MFRTIVAYRFTALVLLCLISRTGRAQVVSPADPPTQIPYVADVRAVETKGLPLVALAGDNSILQPSSQFGAVARIGWSDAGLCAWVQVTDTTPHEAETLDRLYEGDSVELYLQSDDPKAGMLQFIVAPGRDKRFGQIRQHFYDYRSPDLKTVPPVGETTVRTTPTGYTMQMFLPWKNLRIPEHTGSTIGARISVNDGRADLPRTRLTWVPTGSGYDFWKLPTARLSNKMGNSPEYAAWGGYTDYKTTHINLVALSQWAGRRVEVREKGEVRATGTLQADGERSAARLSFPAPPPGQNNAPLKIWVNNEPLTTLTLPALEDDRRDMFGWAAQPWADQAPAWVNPRFDRTVFDTDTFPAFAYPEPERIRRLVGKYAIGQKFYNTTGEPAAQPNKPGRYGAITTITGESGAAITLYTTLFRLDPKSKVAGDAVTLAADPGGHRDPRNQDQDWWHALRKRLGTAIQYESYVHTPPDYDTDKSKSYPVIFYLHGSGGGDEANWNNTKLNDGPQYLARTDPKFPFIVVSLRSPEGWYPPAVRDALDAVEAQYRVDKTREYLSGFSMGGIGSWQIAYDQPHRFAAIVLVGGRDGDPSRAAELKGNSFWVFNGADDTATSPDAAKRAVAALQAAHVDVRYTEIPRAGHVDSLNIAFRDPELYSWLLVHRRK